MRFTKNLNLPLLVTLVLIIFSLLNLDRKVYRPKQVNICHLIAKPFKGEVREFYENGQILTRAKIRKGKIQGHASVWRKNGKLKSDRMYFYAKGKQVYVKNWHENGQLEESYTASRAVRDKKAVYLPSGQYQAWYPNGQLKHSATYRMGKLIAQSMRASLKKFPRGFWMKDGTKLKNSIPKTLPAIPIVPDIWFELGATYTKCKKMKKPRRK